MTNLGSIDGSTGLAAIADMVKSAPLYTAGSGLVQVNGKNFMCGIMGTEHMKQKGRMKRYLGRGGRTVYLLRSTYKVELESKPCRLKRDLSFMEVFFVMN